MQGIFNDSKSVVAAQNISYYDKIAAEYDQIMKQDNSNEMIRKEVAKKFHEIVQPGIVLDFGGGTGLDLGWLLQSNHKIIFCEPSTNMKDIAMHNCQNSAVTFLDNGKTDFHTWNRSLPFPEKADAVLCNFAVLNCIPDIKFLFYNLASVIRTGANFFALILDNSFEKMMKQSRHKALMTAIFNFPFRFPVHSRLYKQTVYIHTDKTIKKISAKHFEFKSKETWSKYGFSLIHLVKK